MAPERDAAVEPERKPFGAWLQEQRNGGLHGELSDELASLVSDVVEHEKAGKLMLTITVNPNGDGSVFVADSVKVNAPEPDRPKSLFFADGRGNLSRRDPRQAELPLRKVGDDRGEGEDLREASSQ